ncbi:MAG TPA: hypothetical protein VES01_05035 [Dermatophilaceae bacterium]|nr:hypothetical protein [Dermatophilaceae bacterium]
MLTQWHGLWGVARVQFRTGRPGLVATAALAGALVLFTARSIVSLYDDPMKREVYRRSIGTSPVSMAFNGRGYDLDELGGIVVYEIGFFALVILPVFAIHLAIRHTRGEEDLGRADLVTAGPVGRLAPLGAAVTVVGASLLAGGLLTWAALVSVGLEAAGSARYAVGLTLYLGCCATLGVLAGQVATLSRSALGLALGTLALTYLVRGVVDGMGLDAVGATPMGWLAEVRPFGDWQLWPMLSMAALAVVGMVACVQVRQRRDLGGGLLAARPGPPRAARGLAGPVSLLWWISRGGLAGWVFGVAIWGVALGLLTSEVRDIVANNSDLGALLGAAGGRIEDGVVSLGAATVAVAAAAATVQSVGRMLGEESLGRLGLVLSTRVGRVRWWLGLSGLLLLQSVVTVAAGGLALGLGVGFSLGAADQVARASWAALAFLPSVWLVSAVAAAMFAWRPAWAVAGWALVSWGLVVVMLGETLRLAPWARYLSPFEHTGRVPLVEPDATALWVLSGLSATMLVLGGAWFARRDLIAG